MFPSEAFKRDEFACRCGCGFNTVDAELLAFLDALRETLRSALQRSVRIKVTSGCRCKKYNKSVNGAPKSLHTTGRAADIQCDRFEGTWGRIAPDYVAEIADTLKAKGLGRYNTFTHIDSRDANARWDNRTED